MDSGRLDIVFDFIPQFCFSLQIRTSCPTIIVSEKDLSVVEDGSLTWMRLFLQIYMLTKKDAFFLLSFCKHI